METFWRNLGFILGRRWVIVVIAFAVITAVLAPGLSNLEFATGEESYLNQDSQTAIDNELFQDRFGGESIIFLFQATDDAHVGEILSRGDNLAEFQRIEEELRAIPEVYSVITPHTALVYSENVIDQGVGTAALSRAIEREPDEEGKALRQADLATTLARLPDEAERTLGNPTWDEFLLFGNQGVVVTEDGAELPPVDQRSVRRSLQTSFVDVETAVGAVLLEGNISLEELSSGTDAVLEVMETAEFDGFELTVTGSPVFLGELNDYLQGGMLTLGAIALVVMAVVLFVMFRVRWRFLPLLSTVVGVVWAFAVLGYVSIDLSLVTISGLPILIGLGIDFAIQMHNRIEEEAALDKEAHPISEAVSNIAPALVAATIAAVVAFLALRVSQVPMIRDFGVMLAIGILVLVACGIVLPATILGVREFRSRTRELPESNVERVVVWLGGLPAAAAIPLVVGSVVLFVAGIALEGGFRIESEPLRWVDQDSQSVKDLEMLSDETGFASTLGILVTANNIYADEVAQVVHEFTMDAESRPRVAASSSLVGTMAKIIEVPGATSLAPVSADLVGGAEALPPDIERALLADEGTATQVGLRLELASLEERADLIEELEAELDARIAALDLPEDSILLEELEPGEPPIRAVPAGLAIVGVALLENLSANRAVLTYLGLALVALFLLLRFRSLGRALLTLVPIGLAIGASSVAIGLAGLTLSPLTTVSGPLVIATCTEFSVLITARYLEERQAGKQPRDASNHAARRTGRAFFTSAVTTIGGFAVLIGSALPLLRDFGVIVTLNVAVALLAALVVMPPLLVWADGKGLFPIGVVDAERSVVLAARPTGRHLVAWAGAVVVVAAVAVGLFASAERGGGESVELAYAPVPLPTTTTTTTEPPDEPDIVLENFSEAPPEGLVQSTVFNSLTSQGADPRAANCTHEVLLARTPESELLNLAGSDQEALFALVADAASTCTVPQDVIDAAVAAGL